jgi:hypothetical protein
VTTEASPLCRSVALFAGDIHISVLNDVLDDDASIEPGRMSRGAGSHIAALRRDRPLHTHTRAVGVRVHTLVWSMRRLAKRRQPAPAQAKSTGDATATLVEGEVGIREASEVVRPYGAARLAAMRTLSPTSARSSTLRIARPRSEEDPCLTLI